MNVYRLQDLPMESLKLASLNFLRCWFGMDLVGKPVGDVS